MHCGKTAEAIELPFGVMGLVGSRNVLLDGVQNPRMVRGNFLGGMRRCCVANRENEESFVQNG